MATGKRSYAFCCRRRRLQAYAAVDATYQAIRAAAGSAGAAGAGWAVLGALRVAADGLGLSIPLLCGDASKEARKSSEAAALSSQLEEGPGPRHIAVIMDGNRRYGKRVHGDSMSGHKAGGERLRDFVEWCSEAEVEVLTVFAFSTENWKRPQEEVDSMMTLFLTEVPRLGKQAMRLNMRVKFLMSDSGPVPEDVLTATRNLEEETAACTGLHLNVCLSYGGRGDVTEACRQLAAEAAEGKLDPSKISEGDIKGRLLTGDLPDPDVLIRTSGEKRLSNFLMFQLAYSEFFFLDKHWPEVTREDLIGIINSYKARHRRFGK